MKIFTAPIIRAARAVSGGAAGTPPFSACFRRGVTASIGLRAAGWRVKTPAEPLESRNNRTASRAADRRRRAPINLGSHAAGGSGALG